MVFSWDQVNSDHIGRHGVSPEEAEQVVREATNPFPKTVEDEKFVVWGPTEVGRYLQVIFVLKSPDEVTYERPSVADWIAIEGGEIADIIRVIHAMDHATNETANATSTQVKNGHKENANGRE